MEKILLLISLEYALTSFLCKPMLFLKLYFFTFIKNTSFQNYKWEFTKMLILSLMSIKCVEKTVNLNFFNNVNKLSKQYRSGLQPLPTYILNQSYSTPGFNIRPLQTRYWIFSILMSTSLFIPRLYNKVGYSHALQYTENVVSYGRLIKTSYDVTLASIISDLK